MTPSEQQEFHIAHSFAPFVGLHPLQPNPYTEPLWRAAVAQYERAMAPVETRIAGKVCEKLQNIKAQPHQLLREFERHKDLIERPTISKALVAERLAYIKY